MIRGPAGRGRVSVVAQDDIADDAAVRAPGGHAGRTYDVTGPENLTFAEIAAVVGSAAGRRVTYHPETLAEAYASRASYGAPAWQVDAWVSTCTAVAAGEMEGVSTAVPDVAGHPATSLADPLRNAR
ncbi:hypothetical protein GCM10010156_63750 [Planobispora rosea]|uniref:Uncharacterized protein n=1 Tax=Planobispora rosea TaxID=35762 RepID=A0A8J3S6F5_PLARO|nr:hypothetical protein [Planobispora rosea]GGS96787.1 hypothetical protein GCM10010156_63750 [Planobispora rosea]GIH87674.1 hypothetical protein Pro02_60820 [Planobispora rosea]